MFLHMENTKNMSKLSFEFLLFVKLDLKPTPEANRNYFVTKMNIWKLFYFCILLFTSALRLLALRGWRTQSVRRRLPSVAWG